MDEHEVGHLLHHVQGVGDAAGPEGLPEAVDFVFPFSSDLGLLLLAVVPGIGNTIPAAVFLHFYFTILRQQPHFRCHQQW